MQPGGDGGTAVSGSLLHMETFLPARAVKSHSRTETAPVWPLCVETLPPMHLNSVQEALADWCAHIHTCALHVHMGGIHVHWVGLPAGGQRHSTFRTGGRPTRPPVPQGHTCAPCSLLSAASCVGHTPRGSGWGTHVDALSSLPAGDSRGALCPLASAAPPVPLLFLLGPSRSLCFYRS